MMYPACLLLFSYLMMPPIVACFVGKIQDYLMSMVLPWEFTKSLRRWWNRKPPDLSPTKKCIVARAKLKILRDLLLVSAALPQFVTGSAVRFGGYCGITDTSQLTGTQLSILRRAVTLLPSGLLSHDDSFSAVVDTGCSSPISGFEQDFVAGTLTLLDTPVNI